VRVIRADPILHGFTHTYAGATLIGVLSVALGRPICQWLLGFWKPVPGEPFMNWLRGGEKIGWGAAAFGAFLGTYSHVLLDSIMHADMEPWTTLSGANALRGVVSI